jgi:hypothetical protein
MNLQSNSNWLQSNSNWYSTGTNKDQEEFRQWVKSHLLLGPVTVTFAKKDGSERVMQCTLMESKIPPTKESNKKKSDESIAVFDLDKNEWRSFRYDSIKEIRFSLEDEIETEGV